MQSLVVLLRRAPSSDRSEAGQWLSRQYPAQTLALHLCSSVRLRTNPARGERRSLGTKAATHRVDSRRNGCLVASKSSPVVAVVVIAWRSLKMDSVVDCRGEESNGDVASEWMRVRNGLRKRTCNYQSANKARATCSKSRCTKAFCVRLAAAAAAEGSKQVGCL